MRNEPSEEGSLRFVDVGRALGADLERDSRGVAVADFDHDGDLDLAINHNPGDNEQLWRRKASLLRNDIGEHRSWLALDLEGTTSNRDAIGAVVTVRAGGRTLVRQTTAGSAYASQSSLRLHFGLGEAQEIEDLEVRWPGGATEHFGPQPTRRVLEIRQGSGSPAPSAG